MKAAAGFTLLEVVVGLALLSLFALGMTRTMVTAQRALVRSARWMRATALAADGVEQVRAGGAVAGAVAGPYQRSVEVTEWPAAAGLYRVDVTVEWTDGDRQRLLVTTLVRR